MFFLPKNTRMPDNLGECRVSLNILKKCGYNQGLCTLLNTDPSTGIIGDASDIKRRKLMYGEHTIAMPTISSFFTLLSRNFEDTNVIYLIWAATAFLCISLLFA